MLKKFDSVCCKLNHKSKPIEMICFNDICRNDPLICLKCLQPHRGHLLESIDNLIEALEKYLSGMDKNSALMRIDKVKEIFLSIRKQLEHTENAIIQIIEKQHPVNFLNSIVTNLKSKEYFANNLNHIFETCELKGQDIIFRTDNSNNIDLTKLQEFHSKTLQEIIELNTKY